MAFKNRAAQRILNNFDNIKRLDQRDLLEVQNSTHLKLGYRVDGTILGSICVVLTDEERKQVPEKELFCGDSLELHKYRSKFGDEKVEAWLLDNRKLIDTWNIKLALKSIPLHIENRFQSFLRGMIGNYAISTANRGVKRVKQNDQERGR